MEKTEDTEGLSLKLSARWQLLAEKSSEVTARVG